MTKVGYYNGSSDLLGTTVPLNVILNKIGTTTWKERIERLRDMSKEDYDSQKRFLPAITFNGTFNEGRKDSDLKDYSNFIVLDIDHIEPVVIEMLKKKFAADNGIYAAFTSPSGHGIKVLVRHNATPDRHACAFELLETYFEQEYGQVLDPSGKNLSRLCYVSYDPDIYINTEALELEVPIEFVSTTKKKLDRDPSKYVGKAVISETQKIYVICKAWVERTFEYVPGQRNSYVYCLCCTLNRCGVLGNDAFLLVDEHFGDMDEKERRGIVRKAYHHRRDEFGTVNVYDLENDNVDTVAVEKVDIDAIPDGTLCETMEEDVEIQTRAMLKTGLPVKHILSVLNGYIKYMWLSMGEDVTKVSPIMRKVYTEYIAEQESGTLELSDMGSMGEMIASFKKNNEGVRMFIEPIDDMFGGSLPMGTFFPLIGVGGTFKSILAAHAATENAKAGIGVLYLNGEMSVPQFFERVIEKEMGIDLASIRHLEEYGDLIRKYSDEVNAKLGYRMFVVNSTGWSRKSINSTMQVIKRKYNVDIGLVVIDGLAQMSQEKKEEAPNLIHQSEMCKELAKEANGGKGCVVFALSHTSGAVSKHNRDPSKHARGGMKIVANSDGHMCTSLLIDPISIKEGIDDLVYRNRMFYLRVQDKRGTGGIVNTIIQVDRPLKLVYLNVDPSEYEVTIK